MKDTEFILQVANNLQNIRKLSGIHAKDVAEHLGISASAYRYLEIGRIELSVSRLKKLAQVFEVKMSSILGEKDEVMNMIQSLREEMIQHNNKSKNKVK